jgi:hypothetical protein
MTIAEKITAALPSNREWAMNALLLLAALYRGERVHEYAGSHFDGRKRKLHNTAGFSQAELIIERAGIQVIRGNDAPRGGILGNYISLSRGNSRIASQVMELYEKIHLEARGRPSPFAGR